MDKAIILRIQKLLALAAEGSGASEAEANSAMEKAHAIMSEHNLTMATIAATGEKGTENRTKEGLDGQAMFDYQRDLMNTIAETNYCYVSVIYSYKGKGQRGKGYQLIGSESNVMTTKVMFEYLMQTINRLVMIEINNDYRQRMSRAAISWCTGCANRLRDRIKERHEDYLREQKRKAEEAKKASQHPASASHGALVVVMKDYAHKEADLNNDFRNSWEPGTTAKRRAEREAARKEQHDKKYAQAKAEGYDDKVAKAFADYYFDNLTEAYNWVHGLKQEKNQKYWEREYRKERTRERREASKRDWSAYHKGSEAGDKIGLDAQVAKGSATKSIK